MATTYLSKNLPANQNSLHKWTYSGWIKRCGLGAETYLFNFYDDDNNRGGLRFNADDTLFYYERVGGSTVVNKTTNRKFRDTAFWYHVMVAVDKSVSSPDTQIYINGVEETSFSTDTDYTQNLSTKINDNDNLYINSYNGSSDIKDQVQTHVHWVSGYKLTPTTFGETDSTSGIWKPKASPSGITYGTNGFFLKFENSAAMGTDSSGNSNTFTVSGTLTQNVDTPSNNFATLNNLNAMNQPTLTNGNNTLSVGSNNWKISPSTLAPSSGKWYVEHKVSANSGYVGIGIIDTDDYGSNTNIQYSGETANSVMVYSSTGEKWINDANTSYGDSYTTNDIIGVAMDLDNNKVYFSKNGTWMNSGNPESGATGTGAIDIPTGGSGEFYILPSIYNATVQCNFGQGYFGTTQVASAGTAPSEGGIFEYDCPSGYQALCTKGINSF